MKLTGESIMDTTYNCLESFSACIGIPADSLVKAFEVEKEFHEKVLLEPDPSRRQALYQQVYDTVHPIYGSVPSDDVFDCNVNPKEHTIWLFTKELAGKSVLDVGCGRGAFLVGIARMLPHKKLLGLDAAVPDRVRRDIAVQFQKSDVVDFKTEENFDVVFSDNVIEHIAPRDLDTHIRSLRDALNSGGTLIVLTPNRLFGPWDVTRIIDDTYTNAVSAQGTHLNEMTHQEVVTALKRNGFKDFKTVLPLSKIRRKFGSVRVPANMVTWLEKSPILVRFFQAIPDKWKILPAFEISIVCTKA